MYKLVTKTSSFPRYGNPMLREDDPPPLPHLMQHSPYNARHTNTSPRYSTNHGFDTLVNVILGMMKIMQYFFVFVEMILSIVIAILRKTKAKSTFYH